MSLRSQHVLYGPFVDSRFLAMCIYCSFGATKFIKVVGIWPSVSFLCSLCVFYTKIKSGGAIGINFWRVRTKMVGLSFIETAVDLVEPKNLWLYQRRTFCAVLNWICQAGTSPGIAVSTPAFASQQHSELQRSDEKRWANAVWTGKSALKCLLDLVVMVISSFWVNLGHLACVQHTKTNCVPQGFSFLQGSVCALCAVRVGACTSCALENAVDLVKPLWRRETD